MNDLKRINWRELLLTYNIDISDNDKKIILIEGVDGSGKSTIIEILLEIIKHCFLLHTSAPFKGSNGEYYKNVLDKSLELIKALNQPFIADRFHIGETVYGKIFRNYNFNYTNIEKELLNLGAKQIYVKTDEKTIRERLRKRGDWYIKLEDVKNIIEQYEEELKKSNLPTYILDTTNNINEEDIINLMRFIYEN